MGKSLSYFFTAVLLIGGIKLIEVLFYEQLKPSRPEEKIYKGEEVAKKVHEEVPEEVDFAQRAKTDSTSLEQEEMEIPNNPQAFRNSFLFTINYNFTFCLISGLLQQRLIPIRPWKREIRKSTNQGIIPQMVYQ